MGDLKVSYLLYFPKLIYCLFAFHGAVSNSTHASDRKARTIVFRGLAKKSGGA